MKSITKQELASLRKTYLADDVNRIVRNALTDRDLESAASVFEAKNANPNLFSIELETMPVTNQKASGRCWIFSTLNVLREMIAKKYHIDFALKKDKTQSPPRYLVFFKGRDADVMTAAFKEYAAKSMDKARKANEKEQNKQRGRSHQKERVRTRHKRREIER